MISVFVGICLRGKPEVAIVTCLHFAFLALTILFVPYFCVCKCTTYECDKECTKKVRNKKDENIEKVIELLCQDPRPEISQLHSLVDESQFKQIFLSEYIKLLAKYNEMLCKAKTEKNRELVKCLLRNWCFWSEYFDFDLQNSLNNLLNENYTLINDKFNEEEPQKMFAVSRGNPDEAAKSLYNEFHNAITDAKELDDCVRELVKTKVLPADAPVLKTLKDLFTKLSAVKKIFETGDLGDASKILAFNKLLRFVEATGEHLRDLLEFKEKTILPKMYDNLLSHLKVELNAIGLKMIEPEPIDQYNTYGKSLEYRSANVQNCKSRHVLEAAIAELHLEFIGTDLKLHLFNHGDAVLLPQLRAFESFLLIFRTKSKELSPREKSEWELKSANLWLELYLAAKDPKLMYRYNTSLMDNEILLRDIENWSVRGFLRNCIGIWKEPYRSFFQDLVKVNQWPEFFKKIESVFLKNKWQEFDFHLVSLCYQHCSPLMDSMLSYIERLKDIFMSVEPENAQSLLITAVCTGKFDKIPDEWLQVGMLPVIEYLACKVQFLHEYPTEQNPNDYMALSNEIEKSVRLLCDKIEDKVQ